MKTVSHVISALVLAFLVISCTKENLTPDTQALANSHDGTYLNDAALLQMLDLDDEIADRTASSTVYTMGNKADGNEVIAFKVNTDGSLTESGRFSTGGMGTDADLNSQGSLALALGGKMLYAVNPGSNDLSVFYVQTDGGLVLKEKVATGGIRPVSVTVNNGLVYVLNAGGKGNITGFGYDNEAKLVPIPGASASLSTDNAGASQVSFTPNGKALVVTEKSSNTITTYQVLANKPYSMKTFPSAGKSPGGFQFGNNNNFYVSESGNGMTDASTVSAYNVDNTGKVSLVDGPMVMNTTNAGFMAMSKNKNRLFTSNTGSNSISSLNVSGFGKLSASGMAPASAMTAPIDAALDSESKFMYVLATGGNSLISYKLNNDGSMSQIDADAANMPDYMSGLVVR